MSAAWPAPRRMGVRTSPITRRVLLKRATMLGASGFLFSCATAAPTTRRNPRVGVLSLLYPSTSGLTESFIAGLADLGYEYGKNIDVECRWNDNADPEARGARAVAELLMESVDLLVAYGNVAQRSAKAVTTRIPIVIVGGSDPIETGLVANLSHPGGNLTGISGDATTTGAKRLDILMESFPNITRVAIVTDLDPERKMKRRASEQAARALGLKPITVEAGTPEDMAAALAAAGKQSPDAVLSFTLHTQFTSQERAFAAARRIPAMYSTEPAVDNGGLMTFGEDYHHMMRSSAPKYVVRILNGEKPGDIPIEQPTKFVFVINMQTARAQGLTIPPTVLARATRVIQ